MTLTKQQEKEVEKEVKKRLDRRIYERARSSARKFRAEFKRHTITAITAAFAFLIALSWREPIKNSVSALIDRLGLSGKAIYFEYLSAILITIIAVLALMWLSKWSSEPEKK